MSVPAAIAPKSAPPTRAPLARRNLLIVVIVLVAVVVVIVAGLGRFGPLGGTPTTARYQIYEGQDTPNHEEAFTTVLPSGWTAQGNIVRPYLTPWLNLQASDASGTIGVFAYVSASPMFVEPGSCAPFCQQGQWYNLSSSGGYPLPIQPFFVWPYLNASAYLQEFYVPAFQRSYPDAQISGSIVQRPDLIGQVYDLITYGSSGADALLTYTSNGVAYERGIEVKSWDIAAGGVSLWGADLMGGSAPVANDADLTKAFSIILSTIRFDNQWITDEAAREGAQSALIKGTFDRIIAMQYQAFVDSSATDARVARSWNNALGAVQDHTDPWSNTVRALPSTIPNANYWWVDVNGNLAATASETNPDSAVYREMPAAP